MAVNLGDINFGLGPDTTRLQRAMQTVLRFGNVVNRAAQDQSEGARAVEAAMRRQEAAMLSALQTTLKLNESIRKTGASTDLLNTSTATFERLTREMSAGQRTALQYQRSMEDFVASTTRAQRAVNAYADANRNSSSALRQASQAARDQENQLTRQERMLFQAAQAVERYNSRLTQLSRTSQNTINTRFDPAAALERLRTQLSAPTATRLDMQRGMQEFVASLQAAELAARKLQTVGVEGLLHRIAQNSMLIAGPLSGVAFRLNLVADMASHVGVAAAGMVAGSAAAAYGFYKLSQAAIDVQKQMEAMRLTLDAVSGSSAITAANVDFLKKVADGAGVSFTTMGAQFAKLEAAAKGTTLEGEKMRRIFEILTLASAKLGLNTQDLEGILRAFQQIVSKGNVTAEELKNQLGDRIPGAVSIMAQALGVSVKRLTELMEAGDVAASSMAAFADTLAKRLGINVGDRIQTIVAAEARLGNQFKLTTEAVDNAIGITAAYVKAVDGAAGSLKFLRDNLDTVGKVAAAVAGSIAAIFAPAIINGIMALSRTIAGATAAMLALNAATLANPLGALANILIRVGAAIVGAVVGWEVMSRVMGENNDAMTKSVASVKAYIAAQEGLKTTVRDITTEHMGKLQTFMDGVKSKMDDVTRQIVVQQTRVEAALATQGRDRNRQGLITTEIELLKDLEAELQRLSTQYAEAGADMDKLNDILRRQKEAIDNLKDSDELDFSKKMAIKRAEEDIRDLENKLKTLQTPPGYGRELLRTQQQINKAVDEFRLKLEQVFKGELSSERLQRLMEQFKQAFVELEQAEWAEKLRVAIKGVDDQIKDAMERVKQMNMAPGQRKFAEAWAEIEKQVRAARDELEKAGEATPLIEAKLKALRTALEGLATKRIEESLTIPLKNAADTIRETEQQLSILYKAPAQKEWLAVQIEVNKAIENYRDVLTRAGVPAEQVAALTERYGRALRQLKEGELILKNFPSLFQSIEGIFSRGLNTAVDQFVDGLAEGKSAAEIWRNVVISVLKDVMKTMLQLAVMNPLKNFLFGTNYPVLGSIGQGAGGALGGLFGGQSTFRNPFVPGGMGTPINPIVSNALPTSYGTAGGFGQGIWGTAPGAVSGSIGNWWTLPKNIFPTGGGFPGAIAATGPFPAAGLTAQGIPLSTITASSGLTTSVSSAYAPRFQNMLNWFEQQGYPVKELGGYNFRNIAGTNRLSNHAFGEAIDINQATNPWTKWTGGKLITDMPPGTAEAARSFGLRQLRGDPMHFEVDKSFKEMSDAATKATNSMTDLGTQVPDVTNSLTSGFSQATTSATQLATNGMQPAAQAAQAGATALAANSAATGLNTTTTAADTTATALSTTVEGANTSATIANTVATQTNSAAKGGGGLFGWIGSLFGQRMGGVWEHGRVRPFALGAVVSRPTLFPMAGGDTGLMGEAGAEAIMPLIRDGGGRLGVRSIGGGDDGEIAGLLHQLIGAVGNIQPTVTPKIINAVDGRDMLSQALSTVEGEEIVLNFIRSRPGAFRRAVMG